MYVSLTLIFSLLIFLPIVIAAAAFGGVAHQLGMDTENINIYASWLGIVTYLVCSFLALKYALKFNYKKFNIKISSK